jgi:acyl-CoA synthetase (AMP-forming)/AMP-acid ligase II
VSVPTACAEPLPEWLRHRASTSPGQAALLEGAERLSFEALDRLADHAARRLIAFGVDRGTRIALLLRSGIPAAVLTHARAR